MKNDTLTIKYIESEMEFNDTLTRFDAIYSGKVNESIVKKMSLNPSIKVRLIGNEKVSGFLAYEVVFSDGVYSLFVHGLYCGEKKFSPKQCDDIALEIAKRESCIEIVIRTNRLGALKAHNSTGYKIDLITLSKKV